MLFVLNFAEFKMICSSAGCSNLARPAGFEPTTLGFGNQYSIQMSYGRFERAHSIAHPLRPRTPCLK